VACTFGKAELVGSALVNWLLCAAELLCAMELVCAAGLLCATELLCAIAVLGAAELLSSDVEARMMVVPTTVFVSQCSLVMAAAVPKAVLMPSWTVVVAAKDTVESIVAYGSVSQEVWRIVEITVIVLIITVALWIFEEHAVLSIPG